MFLCQAILFEEGPGAFLPANEHHYGFEGKMHGRHAEAHGIRVGDTHTGPQKRTGSRQAVCLQVFSSVSSFCWTPQSSEGSKQLNEESTATDLGLIL